MGRKPAKPRRLGRPKLPPEERAPHRPVLAMRVSAEVYDQTAEAAQRSNRKITDEAGHRLAQSFAWEQAFGTMEAMRADAAKTTAEALKGNLEGALRRAGYTLVRGMNGGAWFPPGVNSLVWIFDHSNRHVLEELLARAGEEGANRALAKVAATSDQLKDERP